MYDRAGASKINLQAGNKNNDAFQTIIGATVGTTKKAKYRQCWEECLAEAKPLDLVHPRETTKGFLNSFVSNSRKLTLGWRKNFTAGLDAVLLYLYMLASLA